MAKRDKEIYDDFDELEYSYGPDLEQELFDDTAVEETPENESSLAAWRRIERRQESQWLRSQVVDWDDGDEYLDNQK